MRSKGGTYSQRLYFFRVRAPGGEEMAVGSASLKLTQRRRSLSKGKLCC